MSTLFDQVPAAVARVRREIVLARFIGKLAVDQGIRELRTRLEESNSTREEARTDSIEPVTTPQPDVVRERDELIDATTLALADYDHLPASDVVSKLAGLEPDERDAIEVYELGGRKRRTILGKLEQLKSQER
jgi:hypothetical protein